MQIPLKMKDLEAQTGVTREAIHFYLRQGLLPEPQRPKRNVAHYSNEHVVRIRAIKQLQQERSLSLESIRQILDNFDYDALPAGDDLARFELAVQARVNGELPARDQALDVVAANTGLDLTFLHEAHELGIIEIKHVDGSAMLDFRDVGVLEQWARLKDLGLGPDAGYDLAYLRRFSEAIRPIATFEVDHFLDAFGGQLSDDTATIAAQGMGIMNDILARLRTQAVMRALRRRAS